MKKMWLVARREYFHYLRQKSFLFAAFGIPVFIVVIMIVVFAVTVGNEGTLEDVGQVGYVDQSGILAPAADRPDSFAPYESVEAAEQALIDKRLGAYFIVPKDYVKTGMIELHSYSNASDAFKRAINGFLLANLTDDIQTSLSLDRVKDPVNLTVHILDSGRTIDESGVFGLFVTPLIFSIVFMMASQITSGYLMNGVVEEKTNRIMEILVTSVTPMQMLTGKLLGLGALGLTQLLIWGVASFLVIRFGGDIPFLSGVVLPMDLVIVAFVFFLLGYFLMASLMAGIAAVAGSEEESRQYAGIFGFVLALPFFAIVTFITDPNGAIPVLLTLFPFTAPLTVILRMSFGAVPLVQVIASIGIMLLSTFVITWASARVFRWGLLLYGKRLTPREIWRVIRQSPKAEMAATRPTQEVTA